MMLNVSVNQTLRSYFTINRLKQIVLQNSFFGYNTLMNDPIIKTPAKFSLDGCFFALLLTMLGLLGCQAVVPQNTTQAQPTNTPIDAVVHEIKATKRWRFVYVLKTTMTDDPYWQRVKGAAEQAAQDFGVEVIITGVEQPPIPQYAGEQITLIADLIKEGSIDGLVIGPMDSMRLVPVVDKAIDSGIIVVAQSTPINSDRILTFVGFDNGTAGQLVGSWIIKKLGGQGQVLLLDGPLDQQNSLDRRNAFIEGLKDGEADILDMQSANWLADQAQQITANWLKQFPKIDAIIAANDMMAVGASEAIAQAGRKGIIISGFGGHRPALESIKAGKMSLTIDQMPEVQARLAIQLLIRHLEKNETFPPSIIWSEIRLVTAEN